MRYKIYSDPNRLTLDNHNGSYGNKILHILFIANLCEIHDRDPIGTGKTNLACILKFNFESVNPEDYPPKLKCAFRESESYFRKPIPLLERNTTNRWFVKKREIALSNAEKNYFDQLKFLKTARLPDCDIYVSGHFFEFDLMPNHNLFKKYFSIKESVESSVLAHYPGLKSNKSVAVHYRGTDFSNHLRQIFDRGIGLDHNYYLRAQQVAENVLGEDITYHIFSDDPNKIIPAFEGKSIVIHNDTPELDWAAMYHSKNIIQSNSSFCWTAALYNKNLSIQPAGGYNYNHGSNNIPFGFKHSNAIQIDKDGRVFL
jgi:hypothetical protein